MINWNFDTNDYDPNGHFTPLAPGDYRVRIDEAEETKSKAGKDMIKLVLGVSGKSNKLWFYLVFPNDPHDEKYQKSKAMTNQKLGEVWESFNLKVGDMNVLNWRGHVGAARVKQEMNEQKGEMQNSVSYFLNRKRQENLAPWQEPDKNGNSGDAVQSGGDYGSLRDENDGEKKPWDF